MARQNEASVALLRSRVGLVGRDSRGGDTAPNEDAQVRPPTPLFDCLRAFSTVALLFFTLHDFFHLTGQVMNVGVE